MTVYYGGKMNKIITRETLQDLLNSKDTEFVNAVVGRALSGLLERQTAAEQEIASTTETNGIGFASYDAYSGTLTAKFYRKHGHLLDWQREMWLKKGKAGFARLAKYHRQLNEIAEDQAVLRKS